MYNAKTNAAAPKLLLITWRGLKAYAVCSRTWSDP
jgi:hypothetical protein